MLSRARLRGPFAFASILLASAAAACGSSDTGATREVGDASDAAAFGIDGPESGDAAGSDVGTGAASDGSAPSSDAAPGLDAAIDAPTSVSVDFHPSHLTAQNGTACTISVAGLLQCWGGGNSGLQTYSGKTYLAVSGSMTIDSTGALDGDPGPYADVSHTSAGTCGIRATGELYCDHVSAALTRVGTASDWRRVAVGPEHKMAINAAGTLFGWGDNSWGEVLPGGSTNLAAPTVADSSHAYRDVDVTFDTTCGVRADGGLYCWGYHPVLFSGATGSVMQMGTDFDWTRVRVAGDHGCGLKSSGALYCWGMNDYGQLGAGTTYPASIPIAVGSDTDWTDVAVDLGVTCARKASDAVYCWGSNLAGELGIGLAPKGQPHRVGAGFQSVAANGATSCAITTAGALECWGNTSSMIGGALRQETPAGIAAGTQFSRIALGDIDSSSGSPGPSTTWWPAHFGCARQLDGTISCFGTDLAGEVGLGGASSSSLKSVGIAATEVDLGHNRACAIDASGTLYCWGGGVKTPTVVGTAKWTHAAIGASGGFVVSPAGALYALPPGSSALDASGWTALAGKGDVDLVYGIKNGNIYSLAYGSSTFTTTIVFGDGDYATVAVGTAHRCAIHTTGRLDCWGDNTYGQVGAGTDVSASYGWPEDWTAIAAGDRHTCGIRNGGELYCWGENLNGELGDGSAYRTGPVLVPL